MRCAEKLEKQGLDVYVGGVTAYSTLGWFSDSVFSTIIRRNEIATAALIFHELAHQILYVSDDTTFNESFATTVEQEGLRRWMAANSNPLGYQMYVLQCRRRQGFLALVTTYREKLAELYRQDYLLPEEMRRRKAALFADMRDEYTHLKANWHGYTGYDNWFGTTLNNAKLNAVGTYYDLVPAFTQLLARQDGSLEGFYTECRILAGLPKSERNRRLLSQQPPAVADTAPVGQTARR
jgi:predicted aminopeptidase